MRFSEAIDSIRKRESGGNLAEKYALPAEPYASPTMPQLGRSLLLNVTVTR